ncbi:zona pellucida sperm-binding protein 4-like [Mugil cephalus]|uniref:zona pellucida sperm-binding protein 4-like n=1 Tax=Mugil cephalus TaxID=48193 RepID=UPI001FB84D1A|nr:zona pellucida sperm-binding protein 4-like [Mugil cephalus]
MAGHQVEVLLLLLLLLVSAQGWKRINESELLSLYDDGGDYDEEFPDLVFAAAGVTTSEDFDPFADHELQEHPGSRTWAESVDAPPRNWSGSTSQSSDLDVVCSDAGFQITLPTSDFSEVTVLGLRNPLSVMDAPDYCGYDVNPYENTLTVPFTGCNVKRKNDGYSLQLIYIDGFGRTRVSVATCEESPKLDSGLDLRALSKPAMCPVAKYCAVCPGERLPCGEKGISTSDCVKMGCCVDVSESTCYYPVDECTGDKHFVFAIWANSVSPPLDPKELVIPGNPDCKPVIANEKLAIFKFKITECGARSYDVGATKVYLVEVQNPVKAVALKFGIITRSDPLRFIVECRYSKTATSPAAGQYWLHGQDSHAAIFKSSSSGVQLKLAEDETYSSFYPTYHQPLRLLLGKPLYLELRLSSLKPDEVILVKYCLAFPLSAKKALVLIHEGCANPNDANVSVLKVSDIPKNHNQRHFVVDAFQFMGQKTNKYLNEEIYFMCSAEVCRPKEKSCEERCFDGKAP